MYQTAYDRLGYYNVSPRLPLMWTWAYVQQVMRVLLSPGLVEMPESALGDQTYWSVVSVHPRFLCP